MFSSTMIWRGAALHNGREVLCCGNGTVLTEGNRFYNREEGASAFAPGQVVPLNHSCALQDLNPWIQKTCQSSFCDFVNVETDGRIGSFRVFDMRVPFEWNCEVSREMGSRR